MPEPKAPKAPKVPKVPKAAKAPKQPKPLGKVTHFFSNISVAVIKLNTTLKVGDKIKIEGHGKSFEQTVESMQVEHENIETAKKGQEVGMKVAEPVKEGDLVYKV